MDLIIFVLSGCSSSDSDSISLNQVDVNFVEAPQELWDDSSTNSLTSQINTTQVTVNDILSDKLNIYDIVKKEEKLSNFGQPKANKIKEVAENRFNVPLEFLTFPDEGSGPIIEQESFDIIHTSNLDHPYDQIYDHKYTTHPSDNNSEIKAVLYSNADGSRITMIEKYDRSDEAGYTEDINYFQFIHNENDKVTHLLIYEDAPSKEDEPTSVKYFKINKEDNTIKKAGIVDINKDAAIGKFAAIKNLSNDNMSGVFHYQSNNLASDSDFYAEQSTISDYIQGDNASNASHQRYGYIESFKNHDFDNVETKEEYPSETKVEDFYETAPSFAGISWNEIPFDVEKMEYEGKTFIEALGIVE